MMEEAELQPSRGSFKERADNVKYLFENGMITQEQYNKKIDQLMNEV